MPYFSDEIFDQGLDYATTNGTRIDICHTAEPTTYTEATSTNSCGNKTGVVTGAAQDGVIDGRRVTIPPITAGTVTSTATAGWSTLTNGVSLLVATVALTASQSVTSGNEFTQGAFDLAKRDAA